uniref:Arylacetamide deacetylase-like protein 2 n=1 Tax=Aegilops tauschii TaxID=37682 RepID=N1QUL8_AEGTA
MDPYKYLNIRFNPDGSPTRNAQAKLLPAAPSGEPVAVTTADGGPARRIVHSNDVPLDDAKGTSVRLFVPGLAAAPRSGRLPLIVYFHGGGYVLFRAASEPFHNNAAVLAATVPTAVASVDYRLAPEHRLPAAFDDAVDAVRFRYDPTLMYDACPTQPNSLTPLLLSMTSGTAFLLKNNSNPLTCSPHNLTLLGKSL